MSARIALFIYILAGVLASLSTRAEEYIVELPMTSVEINASNDLIQVIGHYPNPCVHAAKPNISIHPENENTILIGMTGESKAAICTTVVGTAYMQIIDIPAIKYELEKLGRNATGTYKVTTLQGHLFAEVDLSEQVLPVPASSSVISGKLVVTENGFAVQTEDGKIFTAKSEDIDLSQWTGSEIEMSGHVFSSTLPGFSIAPMSNSVSTLFVTGITSFTTD